MIWGKKCTLHKENQPFAIFFLQEKEEGGRGRFKSHTTATARIADREKKAPLKT